jgi:aminoglycoside/choline kinase family phosphotransferase
MTEPLIKLFETWSGESIQSIEAMPRSGSDRAYFRLRSLTKQVVGAHNPDAKENKAFIGFTKHFLSKGLNVPNLLAEDEHNNVYLLNDLGDRTLFNLIQIESERSRFSDTLMGVYKNVLRELPKFQIHAGKDLDYSLCYPRAKFDRQSMSWDLNYFKYYFLKLAGITFDEQALEDDYQKLISFLYSADHDYFMYRDFQSRNIMLKDDDIWFIDYQGGRKGALQYDLASLLYDAKANVPEEVRSELLSFYIEELKKHIPVDESSFRSNFTGFVMIRIMQAMGTYGFRGFYEKKTHFLASIPYALKNMDYLLKNTQLPIELPTLISVLKQLIQSPKLMEIAKPRLKVSVNSFSFRRGVPVDESGHGGGFVFDCRALPNPGRLEQYKQLTGMDQEVIDFLLKEPEVGNFLQTCLQLTESSINNYIARSFNNLTVNFGCTGGQHRSVYLAENFAKAIRNKFDIEVVLRHREQEMLKSN